MESSLWSRRSSQVTRAANKGGTSKGWQFSFEDEIPHPPLVANAPPSSAPAVVSSFFHPISSLPTCACCGDKLLGDIVTCTDCHHKVHVLCSQHGHCFKCACRVCNQPPGPDMRACKTCKHLVHATCAVHVSFRVEVVCKVCTPRPREHPPPAKREKRRFRTEWHAGRPWLQHANGVMWCAACREYPQPGVQQCWVTGNRQLRRTTMKQHGNSGLHCKSFLALWESGGTSTTVIGTLPAPIRRAINGLFQVVYRMAKRGSPPAHIPGDAEALMLSGGTVTTAYHSPFLMRQIVHVIAAPIRPVEGQAIEASLFFALASDSSTDRSVNKQGLVYTRTLREGQFCTAFLGLWELRDGPLAPHPPLCTPSVSRGALLVRTRPQRGGGPPPPSTDPKIVARNKVLCRRRRRRRFCFRHTAGGIFLVPPYVSILKILRILWRIQKWLKSTKKVM